MWSLLDNYEQQYAIINADITSKIGKLKLLDQNDNGKSLCSFFLILRVLRIVEIEDFVGFEIEKF